MLHNWTRPNVKFSLYQKKAGLTSRNTVHLQKYHYTLCRFLLLHFLFKMRSQLDYYWFNVYQQDHCSSIQLSFWGRMTLLPKCALVAVGFGGGMHRHSAMFTAKRGWYIHDSFGTALTWTLGYFTLKKVHPNALTFAVFCLISNRLLPQVTVSLLKSNKVTMTRNIYAYTLELHAACNSVRLSQEH